MAEMSHFVCNIIPKLMHFYVKVYENWRVYYIYRNDRLCSIILYVEQPELYGWKHWRDGLIQKYTCVHRNTVAEVEQHNTLIRVCVYVYCHLFK